MEPFSHEDPLYKLLGKAKTVELRPNFTQNILRAIRQEPIKDSIWAKFTEWLTIRALYAGATAAILLTGLILSTWHFDSKTASVPIITQIETTSPTSTTIPSPLPEEPTGITDNTVASELRNMEQLSSLLAQQDTAAFSDGEIALLLY